MDLQIYRSLMKLGLADGDAKDLADAVVAGVDRRLSVRQADFATKVDVLQLRADMTTEFSRLRVEMAEMKTDLGRQLNSGQRWIIGAIFGAGSLLAALIKFLP